MRTFTKSPMFALLAMALTAAFICYRVLRPGHSRPKAADKRRDIPAAQQTERAGQTDTRSARTSRPDRLVPVAGREPREDIPDPGRGPAPGDSGPVGRPDGSPPASLSGGENEPAHPPRSPEAGTETGTAPPLESQEPPASMTAQILGLVRKTRAECGPEAGAMGKQLLSADNPILRVAGAAILSDVGELDESMIAKLADDPSAAVPLNVLGWLSDSAHAADTERLFSLMKKKGINADALAALVVSGDLTGSGSRMALDLTSASMDSAARKDLYENIATNAYCDYAVRMKSVVLLRDTMAFTDYRNQVNGIANVASDDDPLWKAGISRLSERLEGPAEVHSSAPASLTPSHMDEMLAREYPTMLEDLALNIEYVMGRSDAYIAKGSAKRLEERMRELALLPWTAEQQVSLLRLQSLAKTLPGMETDKPRPPGMLSSPPGAE